MRLKIAFTYKLFDMTLKPIPFIVVSLLALASLCIESSQKEQSIQSTTLYLGVKKLSLKPNQFQYLNYRFVNYGGGDYPTAGKPHKWCTRCKDSGNSCTDAVYVYVKADLNSVIADNMWATEIAEEKINSFSYDVKTEGQTVKTNDPLKQLPGDENIGILFMPLTIHEDHAFTYCLYLEVDGVKSNKVCKTINIQSTC